MSIFTTRPFIPTTDVPLYQQLYIHLRASILAGQLLAGLKLPSTRALAEELGLARNTVVNAYEQLRAEGYLVSVAGSGTFVAQTLPELLLTTPDQSLAVPSEPRGAPAPRPHLSERARAHLTAPNVFASQPPLDDGRPRPFYLGLPALDAVPFKLWSRLIVRRARRLSPSALAYHGPAGYDPLREAIAAHITVSRRVRCLPEQIVITSGTQGALDLLARLLLNPGDEAWLEDPGYFGARGALQGVGARIVPVPVDREGLMIHEGIARAPRARLAFVTPSHQFPLGATLSLARRRALLAWAERADAYILEDDYDSEYRFAGRPLMALQGLDTAGRVIYIGTFSKVLAPALRIGYMVLPPPLLEPCLAVRRHVDFHLPLFEQAVLADFLAEGHFRRHLRRTRTLLAERRAALLAALRALPLTVDAPPTGSHCVGWLPPGTDEAALLSRAADDGLNLWPISSYCIEPLPRQGLIFGYGVHTVAELQDAAQRLATAMRIA